MPVGYALDDVTVQAEQVERAVDGVSVNVLQTLGIVLAVVVLLLGVRTGPIVGAIVPAVMLATLAVMGFIQLPLERMSLAPLVIAPGLLVDNGVPSTSPGNTPARSRSSSRSRSASRGWWR